MPLFLIRPTTENDEITHERKFWTHEIPTRKNLGPAKYPRGKTLDPRNTHEKKICDPLNTHQKIFWTHEIPMRKIFGPTKYALTHDGTMALDPRDPR